MGQISNSKIESRVFLGSFTKLGKAKGEYSIKVIGKFAAPPKIILKELTM